MSKRSKFSHVPMQFNPNPDVLYTQNWANHVSRYRTWRANRKFYRETWAKAIDLGRDGWNELLRQRAAKGFVGPDLHGKKRERIDLSGKNLSGYHFLRADMRECLLTDCNFTRAYFKDSELHMANLARANLTGAEFINTGWGNAKFDNANLQDAVIRQLKLYSYRTNWRGTNLTRTLFQDSKLYGLQMEKVLARDTVFERCDIQDSYEVYQDALGNVIGYGELVALSYWALKDGSHIIFRDCKQLDCQIQKFQGQMTFEIADNKRGKPNKMSITFDGDIVQTEDGRKLKLKLAAWPLRDVYLWALEIRSSPLTSGLEVLR